MVVYADTSFLCSLYVDDANTHPARKWIRQTNTPLVLTHFQRHELRNAVRLHMFRKVMTAGECSQVLANIEEDIHSGALVSTPTNWDEAYARAEILSNSSTGTTGCRASDILHVAIAQTLSADTFLTFDIRQRALAKIAKLKTPL